jgi:hypothetical protein
MSQERPIEYIEHYQGDLWFQNETFSLKDKMKIAFYKRFLHLQERQQRNYPTITRTLTTEPFQSFERNTLYTNNLQSFDESDRS